MFVQETATHSASPKFSSVAKGAAAPKEALNLRLDLSLEDELAAQAKATGDITLSLLYVELSRMLERPQADYWAYSEMDPPCMRCYRS